VDGATHFGAFPASPCRWPHRRWPRQALIIFAFAWNEFCCDHDQQATIRSRSRPSWLAPSIRAAVHSGHGDRAVIA